MSAAAKSAEAPVAEGSGEWGKYVLVVSIALVIVIFDQITKIMVDADMKLYQSIPIIDGFFSLTYVRNTGAAFSMFGDQILDSWNLQDEDGTVLTADAEGFLSLPPALGTAILGAWSEAATTPGEVSASA